MNKQELTNLIENCKTDDDFRLLMTNAINERVMVTDKQLLQIMKAKNEKQEKDNNRTRQK